MQPYGRQSCPHSDSAYMGRDVPGHHGKELCRCGCIPRLPDRRVCDFGVSTIKCATVGRSRCRIQHGGCVVLTSCGGGGCEEWRAQSIYFAPDRRAEVLGEYVLRMEGSGSGNLYAARERRVDLT